MGAALWINKSKNRGWNHLMARQLLGKADLLKILLIVSRTTMVKQLDEMMEI